MTTYLDLLDLAQSLLEQATKQQCSAYSAKPQNTSINKYMPTLSQIPISRVIYSGKSTTVYFTDGTKVTVTCSNHDTYDRQTAIAYALVKRIFGKIGMYDKNGKWHDNVVDGNGIGLKIGKIADAGYDQEAEEQLVKTRKAQAKANHIATQKAQSEAAWRRKVEKRAEEIKLEREANALLDSLTVSNGKTPLNETVSAPSVCTCMSRTNDILESYQKPNKPFSKYTSQEKREYWRYHNAKRRASNK